MRAEVFYSVVGKKGIILLAILWPFTVFSADISPKTAIPSPQIQKKAATVPEGEKELPEPSVIAPPCRVPPSRSAGQSLSGYPIIMTAVYLASDTLPPMPSLSITG